MDKRITELGESLVLALVSQEFLYPNTPTRESERRGEVQKSISIHFSTCRLTESRLTSLGHYQVSIVSEESLLFSPVGPERVQKERRDQGSPQSGTHHAMKLFSPPPHGSCYLENVRKSLCGVSVAPASPAGPKAVKGMSRTHLPML